MPSSLAGGLGVGVADAAPSKSATSAVSFNMMPVNDQQMLDEGRSSGQHPRRRSIRLFILQSPPPSIRPLLNSSPVVFNTPHILFMHASIVVSLEVCRSAHNSASDSTTIRPGSSPIVSFIIQRGITWRGVNYSGGDGGMSGTSRVEAAMSNCDWAGCGVDCIHPTDITLSIDERTIKGKSKADNSTLSQSRVVLILY